MRLAYHDAVTPRAPHPAVFGVLYLPSGIATGYFTVTLGWLLSHAGASVADVATLVSLAVLPNTWRFAWAPIVDTTLSTKAWFRLSVIALAASLAALAFLPLKTDLLAMFGSMALVSGVVGTVSNMAVERFMALNTPPNAKGRAAGWSSAGSLSGTGLGGGGGLWLAQHTGHPWTAGVVLALACLAATLPTLWLDEPERFSRHRSYLATLVEAGRDVLTLIRTRPGLLACVLVVLPVGSGGLTQLWAPVAKGWGAGADEVALVAGGLSGVIGIPSSIAGGWLADRIDKKLAYALFGIGLSAVAAAMAFGPRTPTSFLIAACSYTAVAGLCSGAYIAVALEAVGRGAVATKFNLIASLANAPIVMVILVDGWAETHFGTTGMLFTEAAMGVLGVMTYSVVAVSSRGLIVSSTAKASNPARS